MNGIELVQLQAGDWFRTLLTKRVGKITYKDFREVRVVWKDYKGPDRPHLKLVVEPHPRQD